MISLDVSINLVEEAFYDMYRDLCFGVGRGALFLLRELGGLGALLRETQALQRSRGALDQCVGLR